MLVYSTTGPDGFSCCSKSLANSQKISSPSFRPLQKNRYTSQMEQVWKAAMILLKLNREDLRLPSRPSGFNQAGLYTKSMFKPPVLPLILTPDPSPLRLQAITRLVLNPAPLQLEAISHLAQHSMMAFLKFQLSPSPPPLLHLLAPRTSTRRNVTPDASNSPPPHPLQLTVRRIATRRTIPRNVPNAGNSATSAKLALTCPACIAIWWGIHQDIAMIWLIWLMRAEWEKSEASKRYKIGFSLYICSKWRKNSGRLEFLGRRGDGRVGLTDKWKWRIMESCYFQL